MRQTGIEGSSACAYSNLMAAGLDQPGSQPSEREVITLSDQSIRYRIFGGHEVVTFRVQADALHRLAGVCRPGSGSGVHAGPRISRAWIWMSDAWP